MRDIVDDEPFRELVASIVREVFVENPRLRETFKSKWQSPRAQRAVARANKRIDPTVTEIGATLFGSTRTAITPEFARVLRNKVLHKDKRWLTLYTKTSGNRDEQLAKLIIESKTEGIESSSGVVRLPMFFEYETTDYPALAVPPVAPAIRKAAAVQ